MKLRTQISILLIVFAVLLSGIVFAGFQLNKESVTDRQLDETTQHSERIAAGLDTRLKGLKRTVRLQATNPAIAAHGTPQQHYALKTMVNETMFNGVSVIHRNGTMTGIAAGLDPETRSELIGSDFSDRHYFQRARNGETYISTPVVADSGNYIVTISTPIYRDGTVVGTLNAALHLQDSSIFRMASKTANRDSSVFIRTQAGNQIYNQSAQLGSDPVTANATVNETGWIVQVQTSRDVLAGDLRTVTIYQLGGIGLVLALIGGFGSILYTQILRYHRQLVRGFEALQRQEYGQQVAEEATGDWGQIFTAFNELSQTLAEYEEERVKHRNELQQERDRFRRLFQSIPEPAVVVEYTGNKTLIHNVNEAFEETFGYEASNAVGGDINDFIVPDGSLEEAESIDQLSSSGKQVTHEVRREAADGKRDFLLRSTPAVDGEDEVYFGVYIDITDRKQQERELTETNSVLSSVLDNMPVGILIEDADRTITTANKKLLDILDVSLTPSGLIGCEYAEIAETLKTQFADPDQFNERVNKIHSTRDAVFDEELLMADGRILARSYVSYSLPDGTGNIWLYRDITKNRQRERKLRETLEKTQKLIQAESIDEAATIAVEIANQTLSFPLSSVHLERKDGELEPAAITDAFEEGVGDTPVYQRTADNSSIDKLVWDVYTSGETRVLTDTGAEIPETISGMPSSGGIIQPMTNHGVLVTLGDSPNRFDEFDQYLVELLGAILATTLDRINQKQQIESQRDNLDLLNQIVRHDIRNDLQILLGRLDLLAEQANDAQSEHVNAALRCAENAVELTQSARELSEVLLQNGTDSKSISLNRVVRQQIEEIRSAKTDAEITIDGSIPDVMIRANEMFDSVIRNLLKNAIQHNDKQDPEITISAIDQKEYVQLRIADNGPGVRDAQKESIFGKGEKELESSGTGIGLYLVSTLIESYGGDVWVEDNNPRGAVFVIELVKDS